MIWNEGQNVVGSVDNTTETETVPTIQRTTSIIYMEWLLHLKKKSLQCHFDCKRGIFRYFFVYL